MADALSVTLVFADPHARTSCAQAAVPWPSPEVALLVLPGRTACVRRPPFTSTSAARALRGVFGARNLPGSPPQLRHPLTPAFRARNPCCCRAYTKMATAARRRLMRDFKRMQTDPPEGVNGAPLDNDIMMWHAVIFGCATGPLQKISKPRHAAKVCKK